MYNMENVWIDDDGKLLKDKFGDNISTTKSNEISKDDEFTVYETSLGHWPLCGNIVIVSNKN